MRTVQNYPGADGVAVWFNPWRYCYHCCICHNDLWKHCSRGNDDSRSYPPRRYYKDRDNESYSGRDGDYGDRRYEEYEQVEGDEPVGDRRAYSHTRKQTHVHEYAGSTKLDEFYEDVHDHRIAGVTGEVVKVHGGHVHKVWTRTDFFDHFHYIRKYTGPAIYVSYDVVPDALSDEALEQPHIHFISGLTSINDEHNHEFQIATLIESPLLPEYEEQRKTN